MFHQVDIERFRNTTDSPPVETGDFPTLKPQRNDNLLELTLKINALLNTISGNTGTPQTEVRSAALEASKVLKAGAGRLHTLAVFNSKASAQFILLMNAAAVPADGAVALLYPPIPVAAGALVHLDLPKPLVASTGIAVCNSSTGSFTKTLGAADCVFYAQVSD